MRFKLFLFILLSGIYLSVAGFHAYKIVENSYKYVYFKEKAVALLDFEKRLFNKFEWKYNLFQRRWDETEIRSKLQTASECLESAEESLRNSYIFAFYFIVDSTVLIILAVLLFIHSNRIFKYLVYTIISIALLCLYVGILAPLLEIAAYRTDLAIDIPVVGEKVFEGDIYFYYQCKSISDLIILLLGNNNLVVGVCILIFSVLFPLTKLITTFLVLCRNRIYQNRIVNFIINKIGKWSMTDVFIAAIFLSYLSFKNLNTSIETKSETLLGLYFFLGYCMLSLISSHLTEKVINITNKVKKM